MNRKARVALMIPMQQSKVMNRKAWVVVERERGEDNDGYDNFTMVLILLTRTYFTLHLHLVLLFLFTLVLILLSSNLLNLRTLLYTCIYYYFLLFTLVLILLSSNLLTFTHISY